VLTFPSLSINGVVEYKDGVSIPLSFGIPGHLDQQPNNNDLGIAVYQGGKLAFNLEVYFWMFEI
jgi:hypothetical protein